MCELRVKNTETETMENKAKHFDLYWLTVLKWNYYSWQDMVQNSSNQLMMKFQLSRGILGRGNRLGKPSGVEKLFVCSNVVAKEPNLLPLSHPFQHYFHVILACQIFQSNFLKPNQVYIYYLLKRMWERS